MYPHTFTQKMHYPNDLIYCDKSTCKISVNQISSKCSETVRSGFPMFASSFIKHLLIGICTTIHRYPNFSTRYSVMCKVYTGYCGTSEIEHGLCACTVYNPLAKAQGLSLRTGVQTICSISHLSQLRAGRDSYCNGRGAGYIQQDLSVHSIACLTALC